MEEGVQNEFKAILDKLEECNSRNLESKNSKQTFWTMQKSFMMEER